uniref:Neurotensin/neuromedin N n=1 Tax=Hippocampus comes TaxID=109280 RepID=A0A3Q2Z597_HIPCM
MQAHLACVLLLLCFTCSGLCAGKMPPREQLKQASKQSAPYWRLTLDNLCRLADGLRLMEEGAEEAAWWRRIFLVFTSHISANSFICMYIYRERERERETGNGGSAQLKRKSPYILKRQATHAAKSRRPYILKRSEIY